MFKCENTKHVVLKVRLVGDYCKELDGRMSDSKRRRRSEIGMVSFGLSFGDCCHNARSAKTLNKRNARHNAAFTVPYLRLKSCWDSYWGL